MIGTRLRRLLPGDQVAIISTSYWPTEEMLDGAAAILRAQGLQPVISANCYERWGPLAGTDDVRVAALHEAFANPAIKAILCTRGGYGFARILPLIEFDLIRANPKPLVGYSDLTPLLNYLPQHLDIPTFHGPMVRDWKEDGFAAMLNLLMRDADRYFDADIPASDVLTAGDVVAPICGGNLAMVMSVIGTPYQIDMRGKILLLEDICEVPFRIDRALRQLVMAGALDGIAGAIIGTFVDTEEASRPFLHDERAMFAEYFAERGIPVAMNMPFGHVRGKRTLPIGVPVAFSVRPGHASIRPA